jgi:hypothetical protein
MSSRGLGALSQILEQAVGEKKSHRAMTDDR